MNEPTTTCPACGEDILTADHVLMTMPPGPDPMEPVLRRLARPFRFSKEDENGKPRTASPHRREHRQSWS